MKKLASFHSAIGHLRHSHKRSLRPDVLLQPIDLAVEAERLGVDGAYFRVHHFVRQLASPFPLLAAVGTQGLSRGSTEG